MTPATSYCSDLLDKIEQYREQCARLKGEDPGEYLHGVLSHTCMKLDVLDMAIKARLSGDPELVSLLDEFNQTVFSLLAELKETIDDITGGTIRKF